MDVKNGTAYVRRVIKNSMSRPERKNQFKFYVTDRIKIIEYINNKIFNTCFNIEIKRFYLNKLKAQTNLLIDFYNKSSQKIKKKIITHVHKNNSFFILTSLFPIKIMVSHFVIIFPHSLIRRQSFQQNVLQTFLYLIYLGLLFMLDMSNCRDTDNLFKMFYSNFISESFMLPNKAYFNENRSTCLEKQQN